MATGNHWMNSVYYYYYCCTKFLTLKSYGLHVLFWIKKYLLVLFWIKKYFAVLVLQHGDL